MTRDANPFSARVAAHLYLATGGAEIEPERIATIPAHGLAFGLTNKTGSLRMSSGAERGGQAGRIGKTLKRSNQVDVVIEYPLPEHCQECGATLNLADAQLDERRQVFDIPVAQFQVTEHRTQQLRCTCGQLQQSQFPEGVTEVVQYGTERARTRGASDRGTVVAARA